jgi:hypothetical protein
VPIGIPPQTHAYGGPHRAPLHKLPWGGGHARPPAPADSHPPGRAFQHSFRCAARPDPCAERQHEQKSSMNSSTIMIGFRIQGCPAESHPCGSRNIKGQTRMPAQLALATTQSVNHNDCMTTPVTALLPSHRQAALPPISAPLRAFGNQPATASSLVSQPETQSHRSAC